MNKLILLAPLILLSTTLGAQWNVVHNDPDKMFTQVAFPDEMHGYALGNYASGGSFVLRTGNGGLTWDTINFPFSYISGLHMTGPLKGYAYRTGSPNRIIHTSNGFTSFTGPAGVMDSCFSCFGIGHINDSVCFQLLNEGRLHKTLNYGTGFVPVWDSLTTFGVLDFPTLTTGYIAGAHKLMKTTDAGITWNFLSTTLPFEIVHGHFTTADTGYFSGYESTYDRVLQKTTDGGASFTPVSHFKLRNFAARGIYCLQIDSAGTVCSSGNGGLTWLTEPTGILSSGNEDFAVEITPGGKAWVASSYGQLMTRSGTLSVTRPAENMQVTIFPNPAGDLVQLVLDGIQGSSTYVIYDQTGQPVHSGVLNGNRGQLSLEHIPAGIYFICINNHQYTHTSKLVRQ